jgi:hypothetical protein
MPEARVYAPADRPPVAVLVPGEHGNTWYVGELRMWRPMPDGTWVGNVEYSKGPAQNYLGTFPADNIHPIT